MAEVAVHEEGEIARPLKVLAPLIKQDIKEGEDAGMDFFIAAGTKLNEAQKGHYENDIRGFWRWTEKSNNFGKSRKILEDYMALAGVRNPKSFKSMRDFARRGRRQPAEINRMREGAHVSRPWTAGVAADAQRAREEQRRLYEQEALTRQQERQAEIKLGQRLIAIGYRVLAAELHPDKRGGSREAMSRLNRVRERLRSHV